MCLPIRWLTGPVPLDRQSYTVALTMTIRVKHSRGIRPCGPITPSSLAL